MGYAAWHSSFIPPGSQVRSPLTVPGQYKGLRPCGGMYPLTRVGFLETSSPVRRGEGGGVGKGGPLWSPASCSLCSPVGQRDHPYRRPGKPTHPCIVGAGLAPALLGLPLPCWACPRPAALHSCFHSPAAFFMVARVTLNLVVEYL